MSQLDEFQIIKYECIYRITSDETRLVTGFENSGDADLFQTSYEIFINLLFFTY